MPVILVALAVVALLGGSLPVVILTLGLLKWDRFAVVMRSATQQTRSPRLCRGRRGRRRLDGAHRARRGAAQHRAAPDRRRDPRGGERDPARGGAVVPRSRRAAAPALLGPDDLRGKAYMFFSFWLIAIPGTALAFLVFAINLAGDGLRDALVAGGPRMSAAPRGRRPRASTSDRRRNAARRPRCVADGRARRNPLPRRRIRLRQVDDGARHPRSPAARRAAAGAALAFAGGI